MPTEDKASAPRKIKTTKYAGNWDPNAQQPLSYKLQKWILGNTLLTKNIQVLVYGEWKNQSCNIKPFFTATYSKSEVTTTVIRDLHSSINFLFVGTLSTGKQPLYAIQIIQKLVQSNANIKLEIYGDGAEKEKILSYIKSNNLSQFIVLKGNQNKETLKVAYQKAHFLILPSKSEGWPKAVAEAMFWGCVPLSTNVSCVNNMIDNENRGLLLNLNLENDAHKINFLLENHDIYQHKSLAAASWSQSYTTDLFENEVKKMLQRPNQVSK